VSAETPELGSAGRELWDRMHAGLSAGLRFGTHEREILVRACTAADREAALRDVLDRDGVTVAGSTGQTVLHPALGELRLLESQVSALLQRISLEDVAGVVQSPTHQRAVKAARGRWDRTGGDELQRRRGA
jgi:hypothetical protein